MIFLTLLVATAFAQNLTMADDPDIPSEIGAKITKILTGAADAVTKSLSSFADFVDKHKFCFFVGRCFVCVDFLPEM
jgi:hypothetical protein